MLCILIVEAAKMARIVAGFGLPHVPFLPAKVLREGKDSSTGQFFHEARSALEGTEVDGIVIFSTDHLNTFFFDNLPTFAIGISDEFLGPSDEVEAVPARPVPSNRALASHLRRSVIYDGFDPALVQEFAVDHSIAVPLHFVTPEMNIPVVPIFINGHIEPLPTARRCFELGRSLGRAVKTYDAKLNIAFVGSGSFSLDVLGPRMFENLPFGIPDPDWAERVRDLMESGDIETLLSEASNEQLHKAGNVGGEILNWIAMLGAVGEVQANWVKLEPAFGHAYGFWREGSQ